MDIFVYPHPVLREKSRELSFAEIMRHAVNIKGGIEIDKIIDEMIKIMDRYKAIGISAPQIGLPIKIIAAKPHETETPVVLINPEIFCLSRKTKSMEGCLSLPGIGVSVTRPAVISVKALDRNLQKVEIDNIEEPLSRIIQHEFDHLSGKLIIDHAGPAQKVLLRKKIDKLEKMYQIERDNFIFKSNSLARKQAKQAQ